MHADLICLDQPAKYEREGVDARAEEEDVETCPRPQKTNRVRHGEEGDTSAGRQDTSAGRQGSICLRDNSTAHARPARLRSSPELRHLLDVSLFEVLCDIRLTRALDGSIHP